MDATAAAAPDRSLLDLVATLRRHFESVVLPMWSGPGFNAEKGLPYEALVVGHQLQALPVQRYRTMACARQLYVFSRAMSADAAAHAAVLFDSLCRYFCHPEGGWLYSVGPDGEPLDTTQDLYTYAFVVFACAAYYRNSRDPRALSKLLDTAALIETHFRARGGLYWPQLTADFSTPLRDVEQNPVMHLTEAYLEARECAERSCFTQALRRIADEMAAVFVHGATDTLTELRAGSAGNRIEPGHQFEWYSLVQQAPQVFAPTLLAEIVPRACGYAQDHGVDPMTEGVHAALAMDGSVADAAQRIWAQTEYARALALRAAQGMEPEGWARLQRQLGRLHERFLHPRGWHEVLNPDGSVARRDMPSTTPYHLATCYAALPSA